MYSCAFVYANCIDGDKEIANQRVSAALLAVVDRLSALPGSQVLGCC